MTKKNGIHNLWNIFSSEKKWVRRQLVWVKITSHNQAVRSIAAMFDREMEMDAPVNGMCKRAWYHLYMIQKIRSFLIFDQIQSIVHAYVTSKLDGNNALLGGHMKVGKGWKETTIGTKYCCAVDQKYKQIRPCDPASPWSALAPYQQKNYFQSAA